MRPLLHTLLAGVLVLGVDLACKSSGSTSTSSSSASTTASAAPPPPWIDQARTTWSDVTIENNNPNDAGLHAVRVVVPATQTLTPIELATHMQKLLAIEGTERPCAINLSGAGRTADGGTAAAFVGHVAIEPGVAYSAFKPLEVAKRMVEHFSEDDKNEFQCGAATWFMTSTAGHFEREWRKYVREYSNVWDGFEKNVLEAEKICTRAADLELFKGETFPDSSEAIESGVRFPKMSSQTIKWRSYADFKDTKDWFDCTVNANEAPTISWDHKRE